jgi:uncharacterized protein (TIGR03435 family)
MEDRLANGNTLLAANPKLKKADPQARTGCTEGPPPNAVRSRLLICTNITMGQFADRLPSLAGAYVLTAVLDATGIEGAYDFTLNFSTQGALQRALGRLGNAAPQGAAADPVDAISLSEALTKQLGLKLEMQKRLMPVLVIDHVEEKPTEN